MKILTAYDRKPGRVDGPEPFPFDWEAYPPDYDPERDPVGFGSTEAAAIADLMTMLEEREDDRLPSDRQDRAPGEFIPTEIGSLRR